MKTNLAQIWPGERGKGELLFSEELLELAVLAKSWKDLKKAEELSSSHIPLARQHLLCCLFCCELRGAVPVMWMLYLLLRLPLSALRRTALVLSPLKCLADLETPCEPFLRMRLLVCAAFSSGEDISYPAWAAGAPCPTKIRVYAGISWEVLQRLSYSFLSGCHDSPPWKSLFILSGNFSHQTS